MSPQRGDVLLWGPWVLCFGTAWNLLSPNEPNTIFLASMLAIACGVLLLIWMKFPRHTRVFFGLTMASMFVCGALNVQLHTNLNAAPVMPVRDSPWKGNGQIEFIDKEVGNRIRVLLSVTSIHDLDKDQTPRKIRIGSVRGDYQIGDQVSFLAVLQPPSTAPFTGGYSFSRSAWFKQIGGVGFTYGAMKVERRQNAGGISSRVQKFRRAISNTIRAKLEGNKGAIGAALLTGDKSAIDLKIATAFREAGLGHLLAISGLHMSLVGGLAFAIFAGFFAFVPQIGERMDARKPAAVIGILVAFSYLMISGATAPTQRAFIMLALIFSALLLDRKALSIRNISLAAGIIVLLAPNYVVNPGFQMSFGASLALVAFYQRAGGRFFSKKINQNTSKISAVIFSMKNMMLGIILTSIVAGFATMPFASWHFHKVSLFSLLANILAMPLFVLIVMPFLLLGSLLVPLSLDGPFLFLAGIGIESITNISIWVSAMPGAVAGVPATPNSVLLFESLALIFLCVGFERLKWLATGLFIIGESCRLLAPEPVGWIGDGGAAFLIEEQGQSALVSFGKPDKFALRQFNEHVGNYRNKPKPISKQFPKHCDWKGCFVQTSKGAIAFRHTTDVLEEDCARAELIIVLRRIPERKMPACLGSNIVVANQNPGLKIVLQDGRLVTRVSKALRKWEQPPQRYYYKARQKE